MAGFPERREAGVDQRSTTFGEDAEWPELGIVRVRFKTTDEDSRFGGVDLVERSTVIRVRSWEVVQPAIDTVVTITDGPNAGSYPIVEKPMLDIKGVWDCPIEIGAHS
jgi:hypothetical protein